jgi:hypothetical protein
VLSGAAAAPLAAALPPTSSASIWAGVPEALAVEEGVRVGVPVPVLEGVTAAGVPVPVLEGVTTGL